MSNIQIPISLTTQPTVTFHPGKSPIKPVEPPRSPAPALRQGDGTPAVAKPPALVKGGWSAVKHTPTPTQPTLPYRRDPELDDIKMSWPYPDTQVGRIKLGTIVKLNDVISQDRFQIGTCVYPYAVVIALEPKLILASKDGEGRWEEGPHFSRGALLYCGEARLQILEQAKTRLEK